MSESEGVIGGARWITSIASLRGTDIFASGGYSVSFKETQSHLKLTLSLSEFLGSYDGSIRLWRLANGLKSFSPLFDIPAHGFVNSLQILAIPSGVYEAGLTAASDDGLAPAERRARAKAQPDLLLVAALSKEPRLGRWSRVTGDGTRNGTLIVQLKKGDATAVLE